MSEVKATGDWTAWVEDILLYAEECRGFVTVSSAEKLARDTMSYSAVCHHLQMIGQATGRIPQAVRERCPHIP